MYLRAFGANINGSGGQLNSQLTPRVALGVVHNLHLQNAGFIRFYFVLYMVPISHVRIYSPSNRYLALN